MEVDKRVHVTSKSNKGDGHFAQVMGGGPFFYNERKYFQVPMVGDVHNVFWEWAQFSEYFPQFDQNA